MKKMRNWEFLLLLIICVSFETSARNTDSSFYNYRSIYTGVSFYRQLGYNDPRITVSYSFPFYYVFTHIDLHLGISPRTYFHKDYQDSTQESKNVVDYYSEKTIKGIALIFSFYPTLYLKRFFFGIGGICDFEYYKSDVENNLINQLSKRYTLSL